MTLTASNITCGYDTSPQRILHDVSITLTPGRIVGLTGPSGSGKTTLARILAGLHIPDSGTVTCDGQPVITRRGHMSGAIGLLHQSPRAATNPRLTLGQIISEPLRSGTHHTVIELAQRVGLTADLLDRTPGQVSDGQLQRACLARALAARPAYLLCDEATAMLDPATTATLTHVLSTYANTGAGLLAISHDQALLDAWADTRVDITDLHPHPV